MLEERGATDVLVELYDYSMYESHDDNEPGSGWIRIPGRMLVEGMLQTVLDITMQLFVKLTHFSFGLNPQIQSNVPCHTMSHMR